MENSQNRSHNTVFSPPQPGDAVPTAWTHDDGSTDRSVSQLFEAQVVRGPNVKALKWDDEELSYAELNRRANRLAHVLRSEGVTHETPIGVFLQPSIDLIVVLLAVNKAGGTYIPMDPTHPISRLEFMIQESEVLLVVTHRATGRMLPEERTREFNLDTNSARLAGAPDDNLPVSGNGDSRLYIRYTSGSTGRPKGIELTSRAISRLVINTKHVPVVPGDRVSQLSNPSFDVFAFEMWIALLNGAQLVGVSRNLPLRPAEFATFIAKEHLSVMVLTTAMFNFVARECPDAFTPLKALVVGGEALVPKWIRKVLENNPPAALVNGYGPTEAAVFSTFHLIQEVLEGANSIPIGRPFNGSTIHILNDNLEPVAVGERGELFIGGPGVARGYFNHPKRTAEKFIDDPFREGGKLYRSGDMGRWLPNGVVDFVGRCDNQVKIRSFRVELGDIESILREDKLVSDAAVLALDEDGTDSKRLVAYIEPKDTSLHADRSLAIDAVSALRCRLAKSLPPYMIPTAYALLEKMPFSNNRKIDRQGLVNVELLKMNKTAGYVAPANETEKFIAELWAELLDLERVSTEADWIQLGGTSLLAANQLLRIHEKFDANISAHQFYANATVKQLARQVDEMRGGQKVDVSEFSRVDLHREAHLDRQVKPDPKAPPYRWCSPNQVLVTGATGFLAAWVVRDLLLKTGATVYCLVRAGDASEAMSRLRQNMQHYRVWDNAFASRIVAVPGDLTKRELGMPRQDYIELAGKIDTIFHSAAHVNYIEPYAWHKAANVHGTIEMIRFAFRSKIKALHHLSTISIFGPNGLFDGVQDIYEDTDIDASARLLHLDMGYSQSKWVAEKLLSQAQERGLPVSLYRSGFILGDSETGVCNVNDFIARLISGCVEMGQYPALPRQRKEFVTVDYASAALVHIAQREDQIGKRFHLVPGASERSVSVINFFELIRESGYFLKPTQYPEWAKSLRELVAGQTDHVMMPLLPALAEFIYEYSGEPKTRWELYQDMPVFHCRNTEAALAGSGIEFKHMDRKLIDAYLEFLSECGAIKRPSAPISLARVSA